MQECESGVIARTGTWSAKTRVRIPKKPGKNFTLVFDRSSPTSSDRNSRTFHATARFLRVSRVTSNRVQRLFATGSDGKAARKDRLFRSESSPSGTPDLRDRPAVASPLNGAWPRRFANSPRIPASCGRTIRGAPFDRGRAGRKTGSRTTPLTGMINVFGCRPHKQKRKGIVIKSRKDISSL